MNTNYALTLADRISAPQRRKSVYVTGNLHAPKIELRTPFLKCDIYLDCEDNLSEAYIDDIVDLTGYSLVRGNPNADESMAFTIMLESDELNEWAVEQITNQVVEQNIHVAGF